MTNGLKSRSSSGVPYQEKGKGNEKIPGKEKYQRLQRPEPDLPLSCWFPGNITAIVHCLE